MRKYRSKLEIIEGILITLSEKQVNKTRLMYATNLNYDLLKKYLFVLESNGFISRNGQKYVITNKGLTLLEKIRKLKEVINEYEKILEEVNKEISR